MSDKNAYLLSVLNPQPKLSRWDIAFHVLALYPPPFFQHRQNKRKEDKIYHGGEYNAYHDITVALAEEAIAEPVNQIKERVAEADFLKQRRQYIDVIKCAWQIGQR